MIDKNLISVVLQAKLDSRLLRHCVTNLFWHTRPPWEFIVLSRGEPEHVGYYLQGMRDSASLRVVIEEFGPAASGPGILRRILRLSRADRLVFLDGEAIVTCGWVDHLEALADSDPSLCIVAPTSNAGSLAHHFGTEGPRCVDDINRFSIERGSTHYGHWASVSDMSSGCFLVKREFLHLISNSNRASKIQFPFTSEALLGAAVLVPAPRAALALDVFVSSVDLATDDPPEPVRDVQASLYHHSDFGVEYLGHDGPTARGEYPQLPGRFDSAGLLPPGDYAASFDDLRKSMLIHGPPGVSGWDADWRLLLADNLEILAHQLSTIGLRCLYIGGSFVEQKGRPPDLDGYFTCPDHGPPIDELYERLNSLEGDRIWTSNWTDRRLGPTTGSLPRAPMWHKYRVELQAECGQSTSMFRDRYGRSLGIPAAFRTCKVTRRPKGIVKLFW